MIKFKNVVFKEPSNLTNVFRVIDSLEKIKEYILSLDIVQEHIDSKIKEEPQGRSAYIGLLNRFSRMSSFKDYHELITFCDAELRLIKTK